MPGLSDPKETLKIIHENEFHFQKKFGQNFLIDENILNSIVSGSGITKDDTVLEIGPGIGTLTKSLSKACKRVIAVEIDSSLIPILEKTLSDESNVTIINEDIMKTDIHSLIESFSPNRPVRVCANLPYYITTPIIMELLESQLPISTITVMVQKEVAQRMMSGPGSKDYGAISLAVQYYSKPVILRQVPASCFIPRPHVDSSVIRLDILSSPMHKPSDPGKMFSIIKASFLQRRKTLKNSLFSGLSIPKEKTAEALLCLGLPEDSRGEALDLEMFSKLSDLVDLN